MTSLFPRVLNFLGALVSLPWLVIVGFPQIPGMAISWFSPPSNQVLGLWDIPGILTYTLDLLFVGAFQVLPIVGTVAALVISSVQLIKPFAISAQSLSHLIWVKSLVPLAGLFLFGAFWLEAFSYPDILFHFVVAPIFAFAALVSLRSQKP